MTHIQKLNEPLRVKLNDILSPALAVERYHQSGKKLQFFREEIPAEILKRLKLDLLKISRHLGIQNPPEEESLNEIVVFLLRNFSDFTPAEIYHSFELFASGRLTTIEIAGKVVPIEKPFGTFNLSFIGSVLNAYRNHRKALLKPDQKLISKDASGPPPLNEEEWNKLNHDILEKYLHENMAVNPTGSYSAAFKYLESAGIIKLTKEDKLDLIERFRVNRILDLRRLKASNPFKSFEIEKEIEQLHDNNSEVLKNQVRDYACRLYFNQLLIKMKNEKKEKK